MPIKPEPDSAGADDGSAVAEAGADAVAGEEQEDLPDVMRTPIPPTANSLAGSMRTTPTSTESAGVADRTPALPRFAGLRPDQPAA